RGPGPMWGEALVRGLRGATRAGGWLWGRGGWAVLDQAGARPAVCRRRLTDLPTIRSSTNGRRRGAAVRSLLRAGRSWACLRRGPAGREGARIVSAPAAGPVLARGANMPKGTLICFAVAVALLCRMGVRAAELDQAKDTPEAVAQAANGKQAADADDRKKGSNRKATQLEEVVVEAKRPLSSASSDEVRE